MAFRAGFLWAGLVLAQLGWEAKIRQMDSLLVGYLRWQMRGGASEPLPFTPVEYAPDVYERRLQALDYTVPMDYNPAVHQFIKLYTQAQAVLIGRFLGLEDFYLTQIEPILRSYGLPAELKYLPLIESALYPEALSPAGAAGIWQFMPSTARLYGLRVDGLVDERYDLIRSTHAAARYLKNMYAIFGDWLLVIASYNSGMGNVARAIKRAGGKTSYWEVAPFLPLETRGYVPAFIAVCYAMNYYKEHNIMPIYPDIPLETDTVYFPSRVRLSFIARQAHVPLAWLKFYNPELRRDWVLAGYSLRVPAFQAHEVATLRDRLQEGEYVPMPVGIKKGTSSIIYHTVGYGETLFSIARKYQVTPYQIVRWNALWGYRIQPGWKLKIFTSYAQEDASTWEALGLYDDQELFLFQQAVGPIVYLPPREHKPVFEWDWSRLTP
ncbi:MAG: transglycosylase SLT domain-containing protein [Bacteroidia bacterium]